MKNKFICLFLAKLIHSRKWKHDYIISRKKLLKMAESNNVMTWESDNIFVPQYVPKNLEWFEKDGLETWYQQNKCKEFLDNADIHFAKEKLLILTL